MDEDLGHQGTRELLDLIMDRTKALFDKGMCPEVLTVDNHADGPYVYLRLLREDPERAAEVLKLLNWNEGNSSGRGIGCISWDGKVHPDQFWRHLELGNVRERPFSEIWSDTSHPILGKLKDKRPLRDRALRHLPLAGHLRGQLPGARRGGHRRPLGPGPGLLPDR